MSCFFGSSFSHLSQFCDIYVDNESRKKQCASKKCCINCLRFTKCKDSGCYFLKKCYICFSLGHHTVFCPDRLNGPNISISNIDRDIVPRFLQMFDASEQFLLTFLFPKESYFITLKSLKIVQHLIIFRNHRANENLIVTDSVSIENSEITFTPSVIIKAKTVDIKNTKFSAQSFLLILSSNIKILKCSNVSITSKITFSELIKKLPNIEILEIQSINIEVENSWPEKLLKHVKGKNFQKLKIKIKNMNFNVENFATFIWTKCARDIHIILELDTFEGLSFSKIDEEINQKFTKHFIRTTSIYEKISRIFIFAKVNDTFAFTPMRYHHEFGCFTLK